MAFSNNNNTTKFAEGVSSTRPPLDVETNYNYWKTRLLNYFLTIDLDSYFIITKRPRIPIKKDSSGKDVPKLQSD